MTFGIYFLQLLGMFGQNLVRLAISILRVLLQDLLDDLSDLVLGFDRLSSLLLYSVNAPSFFVELNQSFSSRVFNLQGFRSFPDRDSVFLREFDEHSPCLRGDRVVMVSFLGVCFVLWNFGEHFTKVRLYWVFNFKLSIQNSDWNLKYTFSFIDSSILILH